MNELNEFWKNVLQYIWRSRGKNVNLMPLQRPPAFCGVILHDEGEAFRRAQGRIEALGCKFVDANESAPRCKGWAVDFDGKRVLLLETGMGSMNASVVIHELAAGLLDDGGTARRIIKIGTCGGLHRDQPAGSVFVPDCALEDEGASKWNVNDLDDQWEAGIIERLKTTKAADAGLTNEWRRFLEITLASEAATANSGSRVEDPLSWWSSSRKCDGTGKVRSSCVWTIDTFHARRAHAQRIFDLVERHMQEQTETFLVGIENECSSHFSAASHLNLRIAAALVVSWSHEHVSRVRQGKDPDRDQEKERVHDIESGLITKAVSFLLNERPR